MFATLTLLNCLFDIIDPFSVSGGSAAAPQKR